MFWTQSCPGPVLAERDSVLPICCRGDGHDHYVCSSHGGASTVLAAPLCLMCCHGDMAATRRPLGAHVVVGGLWVINDLANMAEHLLWPRRSSPLEAVEAVSRKLKLGEPVWFWAL